MAIEITVPRLGWTMEEGVFVGWLKQDGEQVSPGDMVFELEGEKASQEIESLDGGVLRIPPDAPKPGEVVTVGAVLGYLVSPGEPAPWESAATPKPSCSRVTGRCETAAEKQLAAEGPARDADRSSGHRSQPYDALSPLGPAERAGYGREAEVLNDLPKRPVPARSDRDRATISPRARRVAQELGVDWTTLRGSGRAGRIRERDIRAAATGRHPSSPPVSQCRSEPTHDVPSSREAASATVPGRTIPITPSRRAIAKRMSAGVHQAAPVTLFAKSDATNLVNLREQFRTTSPAGDRSPNFTDLIVKLTAITLRNHPMLRAQWRDDGIFVPDGIHIAIAVDAEAGLLAPVLRNADKLSLRQLAIESAALIERARSHTLPADQLEGGTFTVSNLGMYGIDVFTPILNLPQCAILGVGRIMREPAILGSQIVPRDLLSLSLTFDHRVLDGAPAARFLDALGKAIENPAPLLIP